jgi:hypothetical protein
MRKEITLEQESAAPLSREQQIAILQDKLKDAPPKAAAAIARRIALLSGTEKPYAKTPQEQAQRDRALAQLDEPKPDPLAKPWWARRDWTALTDDEKRELIAQWNALP